MSQQLSYKSMIKLLEDGNESEFIRNFYHFNCENCSANEIATISCKAVKIGSDEIIQLMLNAKLNVNDKSTYFVLSPMQIAARGGYYKVLKLLADDQKHVDYEIMDNILHESSKNQETFDDKVDYVKCFDIIAKYINVNDVDEYFSNTPLHCAVSHQNHTASLELMKRNAFIGAKNIFNETPLDEMKFQVLKEALDDRVTLTQLKENKIEEICVDFNIFVGKESKCGVKVLEIIAKNSKFRSLVTHPVIASFIDLKLRKLRWIFYTNFIVFLFFLLALISYLVMRNINEFDSTILIIFHSISSFGIFLLLIREIIQCCLSCYSRINYFKSLMNIFEIIFIILAISSLTGNSKELHALTIICAAFEILHLMNELPNFWISCHMQVLQTVALTFIKSLALYSIILIAFAMSFFILFSNNESKNSNETDSDDFANFASPKIALIKTFVMLTGEFDASSMSLDKKDFIYPLMFLLFIFIVTIALFNLLSALAVDDTQQIKDDSELYVLCKRIKVVKKYEKMISEWKFLRDRIELKIRSGKIRILSNKGFLVTEVKDENEKSHNSDSNVDIFSDALENNPQEDSSNDQNLTSIPLVEFGNARNSVALSMNNSNNANADENLQSKSIRENLLNKCFPISKFSAKFNTELGEKLKIIGKSNKTRQMENKNKDHLWNEINELKRLVRSMKNDTI